MRQNTCFSVVEMRSENVVFVSENEGSDLGNEGSDLGIPWPHGPRRQIAQWAGTRTAHPGGPGVETGVRNQYLPKTRECVSPFPQGLFMPPKTRPKVFP